MNRLTAREVEVLEVIREVTLSRGVPPTVRELCQAIGVSSSSTVHSFLTSLKRKGFVTADAEKPRTLRIVGELSPAQRVRSLEVEIASAHKILDQLGAPRETPSLEGVVTELTVAGRIHALVQQQKAKRPA